MPIAPHSSDSVAPISGTHKVRTRRTVSPFTAALRRLGFTPPDPNVGQSLTLDTEWTIVVYRGKYHTMVSIERQREEWEDPATFQSYSATDRARCKWKHETRKPFSHNLPLPSHIVGKWEALLAELGVK
jgi:hypothetical protein